MCFGYDGHAALRESLEGRGTSRRSFLKGAAATVAGATVAGGAAAPAMAAGNPGRRRVPRGKISIQLYTLREIMTGDGVDTTLEALADYGYPRVELAGLYGRTPAAMRAKLDSLGIKASSSHDGISTSTSSTIMPMRIGIESLFHT